MLTQLTKIGAKAALKLSSAGFDTFDKIKNASVDQLQSAYNKNTDFILRLKTEANLVPKVELVDVEQLTPLKTGIATIKITVKLHKTDTEAFPGLFRLYISSLKTDGLLYQRKLILNDEGQAMINDDSTLVYAYDIQKKTCETIANTYGQSRILIQLVHEKFLGNDVCKEKVILFKGHKGSIRNTNKSSNTPNTNKKRTVQVQRNGRRKENRHRNLYYYRSHSSRKIVTKVRAHVVVKVKGKY